MVGEGVLIQVRDLFTSFPPPFLLRDHPFAHLPVLPPTHSLMNTVIFICKKLNMIRRLIFFLYEIDERLIMSVQCLRMIDYRIVYYSAASHIMTVAVTTDF